MSKSLQFFTVVLLSAMLAGGWWWFAGRSGGGGAVGKPKRTNSTLTPVLTEPLIFAADRFTVRAIGTGRAVRSAVIHPEVSGEVVEVFFKADQRVKKGQPLLRLDDDHQRLAVRLAEVALKEARRHRKRLGKLVSRGAVSRAQLETAQAALESDRLRLAQAQANLSDRTVFAAFDGVVGLTEIDPGDRVTEDTAITTLDDRSSILVEFTVPENYAGGIRLGDAIKITAWSRPGQILTGVVAALGSRIDKTTRTLTIRAEVENPTDVIRPGSSFEVQFDFIGRNYPKVREVAVMWSRDGAYLWRVIDGKAEKVFVKLVRRERGHLLVDGPLLVQELVVVEGVQGLRSGQKVKAIPFDANAASKRRPKKAGNRP